MKFNIFQLGQSLKTHLFLESLAPRLRLYIKTKSCSLKTANEKGDGFICHDLKINTPPFPPKAGPLTKRYVLLAMNRILLIILISLTLTGCPVSIKGFIKNKSESTVIIVPPFKTEFSWIIGPGSEEEVRWYEEWAAAETECNT